MTNKDSKDCNFCGKPEKETEELITSHEFGGCICRSCIYMSLSYLNEMEEMVDAIMEGIRNEKYKL